MVAAAAEDNRVGYLLLHTVVVVGPQVLDVEPFPVEVGEHVVRPLAGLFDVSGGPSQQVADLVGVVAAQSQGGRIAYRAPVVGDAIAQRGGDVGRGTALAQERNERVMDQGVGVR
ncbi:hypothetical protein CEB94_00070 [Streptomyces hawaiiensis]|uniref:Uncharacterized protein n=1 Tax=Streptomyces hawaiiensis TaxID=67305 RepID=A0A6G5R6X7_9ACTN|nr:hypothetical protein CEB94_00070 [Streptomyces hawaiiensis]